MRGSGEFEEEFTLWRGLIQRSTRKFRRVSLEVMETKFLKSIDLAPPAELVAEVKKMEEIYSRIDFSKIDFSKGQPVDPSKPLPFPGPPRPTFGFTFAPVSGPLQIEIVRVFPGSPADKAGLRQGDIITGIGGEPFSALKDRKELFARMGVQQGEFTIRRDDTTLKVTMAKVDSASFAPAQAP
jgi:predicted metalloprotease with PDZ domain